MSKSYTYTKKNKLSYSDLVSARVASTIMTNKNIQSYTTDNDGNITIVFDNDLSSDDKQILDLIMSEVPGIDEWSSSDDSESSTTSGNYVNKLSVTYTPNFSGYVSVFWSCEVTNSKSGNLILVQVSETLTSTTINQVATTSPSTTYFIPLAGKKEDFQVTPDTTYTFVLSYAAGSNTAKIRRARLFLMRRS
jgi:hypothetical protein